MPHFKAIDMKKKIIVADDDNDIVNVLTIMLEDAGYEVRSTDNDHLLKMVSDYLPNLLLLDIWMGGMDGGDVCKHLKSQKTTKDIPIILISANHDTQKIAQEAGADDFIAKPFDMDDLLKKVAKYCR